MCHRQFGHGYNDHYPDGSRMPQARSCDQPIHNRISHGRHPEQRAAQPQNHGMPDNGGTGSLNQAHLHHPSLKIQPSPSAPAQPIAHPLPNPGPPLDSNINPSLRPLVDTGASYSEIGFYELCPLTCSITPSWPGELEPPPIKICRFPLVEIRYRSACQPCTTHACLSCPLCESTMRLHYFVFTTSFSKDRRNGSPVAI